MHTGGVRGEGGMKQHPPPQANFWKNVNKNAIKRKIGGPPLAIFHETLDPPPPLGFWQKHQVPPPPWIFNPCASMIIYNTWQSSNVYQAPSEDTRYGCPDENVFSTKTIRKETAYWTTDDCAGNMKWRWKSKFLFDYIIILVCWIIIVKMNISNP